MIKALINGIISLVISLVNLLLTPINTLINNNLPGVAHALELINSFFDKLGEVCPFVISYFGLSTELLNLIVDLSVFILSIPLLVTTIKVAVKWYNNLKV